MIRRISALASFLACVCLGLTPHDRLAGTVKLWAYFKYCHPGVTAPGVVWDAALAEAAPKVLTAQPGAEFSAVLQKMLEALHDPATRMPAMGPGAGDRTRVKPVVTNEDGLQVVRLEKGDFQSAAQMKETLFRQLPAKSTILIDLRDSEIGPYVLPSSFGAAKAGVGPSRMMRAHSGYQNDAGSGSGGYESYWETHDGMAMAATPARGLRVVYLVNHLSAIPELALAVQNSGNGAIVSEDEIGDHQVDTVVRPFPVVRLYAMVRTSVLAYADGTTGVAANVVLHQTGDTALATAKEIAKSGNWPAPAGRARLALPPARFQEKAYGDQMYPSEGIRMVAAARIWGVFQYFHPYRDLYGEDWDAVLTEFVPKMAAAKDAMEYQLLVAEMVSHVHDSHSFLAGSELAEFYGQYQAPVELRWIENKPVVTRVFEDSADLKPGDVLTKIDGEAWEKRGGALEKHIAASTPQSLMNRTMQLLLNGPTETEVKLTVQRRTEPEHEVTLTRKTGLPFSPYRGGEIYRLLTPKIGYVDLERLANADVDAMFEKFKDTDAIIMDMRGYPQGTAWSIAPRLAEKQGGVAASFRRSLVNPDTFGDAERMSVMFDQRIPVTQKSRYAGKTVMLIDERAISQSEHSGLFFRAANGTRFIGSPTQGANGDVTYFVAPGGVQINFSGHDVRWPDGRQLQRVGLTPDIEVRPTIEGIRVGRDEVLERAMAWVDSGR